MCTRLRKSIVLSENNRTVQGSLSPSLLLGYPKRVLGLTLIFLMQSEKSTKKSLESDKISENLHRWSNGIMVRCY